MKKDVDMYLEFFLGLPKEIEHSLASVSIDVKGNKWSLFIYVRVDTGHIASLSIMLALHYLLKMDSACKYLDDQ